MVRPSLFALETSARADLSPPRRDGSAPRLAQPRHSCASSFPSYSALWLYLTLASNAQRRHALRRRPRPHARRPSRVGARCVQLPLPLFLAQFVDSRLPLAGNTFTSVVFITFGGFWWSFGYLLDVTNDVATTLGASVSLSLFLLGVHALIPSPPTQSLNGLQRRHRHVPHLCAALASLSLSLAFGSTDALLSARRVGRTRAHLPHCVSSYVSTLFWLGSARSSLARNRARASSSAPVFLDRC